MLLAKTLHVRSEDQPSSELTAHGTTTLQRVLTREGCLCTAYPGTLGLHDVVPPWYRWDRQLHHRYAKCQQDNTSLYYYSDALLEFRLGYNDLIWALKPLKEWDGLSLSYNCVIPNRLMGGLRTAKKHKSDTLCLQETGVTCSLYQKDRYICLQ